MVSDPMLTAIYRKATHPLAASRYSDAIAFAAQLKRWLALKTAMAAPAAPPRPQPAARKACQP